MNSGLRHMEHDKGEIERHRPGIQETLTLLDTASSPLNENDGGSERGSPQLPPVLASEITTGSSERALIRLIECKFVQKALIRLVERKFIREELLALIEAILVCKDLGDMISLLSKNHAQTFVDVMDEALARPDLPPWTRARYLKQQYRACGCHANLPTALKVPICYDRTEVPSYQGGYADVWKSKYCGRDVAVKVIRMYSNTNLQKVVGRFCKEVVTWKTLQHPNLLPLIGVTMTETQFAMVSDWMANGNINEYTENNPAADRLELLRGVARGLIYIHYRGMVHGDLKGVNILIDQSGNARLADFGLLTIISDPANLLFSSSRVQGGTTRWMSPELLFPGEFGLKTSRPTKSSDCYSLGMVIYETIGGNPPFHEDTDAMVIVKVLKGARPRHTLAFGGLWEMLQECWAAEPGKRPSIEVVLHRLDVCSISSTPCPMDGDTMRTKGPSVTGSPKEHAISGSRHPPTGTSQGDADLLKEHSSYSKLFSSQTTLAPQCPETPEGTSSTPTDRVPGAHHLPTLRPYSPSGQGLQTEAGGPILGGAVNPHPFRMDSLLQRQAGMNPSRQNALQYSSASVQTESPPAGNSNIGIARAGRPYHISFGDIFLVKLIQVTRATWQPVIWYRVVPGFASA